MPNLIPNEALCLSHLPDPDDSSAVFAFAHTFDGYAHFGSLDAAAANAEQQSRQTLVDLRNELFFAARASRFVEGADDMVVDLYLEIRPLIIAQINERTDS